MQLKSLYLTVDIKTYDKWKKIKDRMLKEHLELRNWEDVVNYLMDNCEDKNGGQK